MRFKGSTQGLLKPSLVVKMPKLAIVKQMLAWAAKGIVSAVFMTSMGDPNTETAAPLMLSLCKQKKKNRLYGRCCGST